MNDCRKTWDGQEYQGTMNMTWRGETCQRWDKQFPHHHGYNDKARFPDGSTEHNYCRNPDGKLRPWCFTTNQAKRWEFCDIPTCDCLDKNDPKGLNYVGIFNITEKGFYCQRWDMQTPHRHGYDKSSFVDRDTRHNYCRNPNSGTMAYSARPWCFITNKTKEHDYQQTHEDIISINDTKAKICSINWDFCDIPVCDCQEKSCINYTGSLDRTVSGHVCQNWDSQTPHPHSMNDTSLFPDQKIDHSYCRNPDNRESGLWCFTTDPKVPWESCNVETCDRVLAVNNRHRKKVLTRLLSPEVHIDKDHCLRALVTSDKTRVLARSDSDFVLKHIDNKSPVRTYHVTFPVRPGRFQVLFEGYKQSIIHRIDFMEGSCLDLYSQGSVNDDFEEIAMSGYLDTSDYMESLGNGNIFRGVRWIPALDLDKTGIAFAYENQHSNDDIVQLTSPNINVTDDTCLLVWWYFIYPEDVHHAGLKVNSLGSDGKQRFIDKIYPQGEKDSEWIQSKINLPLGSYRIQFENYQMVQSMGIGKIMLADGSCQTQVTKCDSGMHATVISGATGGNLHYPLKKTYLHQASCHWTIAAPPDQIVSIKFLRLSTETCCDFVTVSEGGEQLLRISGSDLPDPVMSIENKLSIRFNSDHSVTSTGFAVEYSYLPRECGSAVSPIKLLQQVTVKFPSEGNYRNNLDCHWNIMSNKHQVLRVEFSHFETQPYQDIVTVHYSNKGNKEFHGFQHPAPVTSQGNIMRINFQSDAAIGLSGFTFRIKFIDVNPECQNEMFPQLLKQPGELVFPSSGPYQNNMECHWQIEAPANMVIRVSYIILDLIRPDQLTVIEDNTHIQILSGIFQPGPVVSKRNIIHLNFSSNSEKTSKGFSLNIEFIKTFATSECLSRNDFSGRNYTGNMSMTVHGRTCQRWDHQTPHTHFFTDQDFPDGNLGHNHCRNPDQAPKAWCFTTDPETPQEYCHILLCDLPNQGETPLDIPSDLETKVNNQENIIQDTPLEHWKDSDVSDFLNITGHTYKNMIHGCHWMGQECNESYWTEQMTDFGWCSTFNADQINALKTNKTGSRLGLRLTINIEQYEYTPGPNLDAGIKIFLHEQDDIPMIRELGFAVAPGLHAIVAVGITQTLSKGKPYGDCGDLDLEYYSDAERYTISRCLRQCETKYLEGLCKCKEPYMPGNTSVCTLEKYLSCVIPQMYFQGETSDECNCRESCNTTVFNQDLSYASLSSFSVNRILEDSKADISASYAESIEMRHRLEPEELSATVIKLKELAETFHNILIFLNDTTKPTDTAILDVIGKAVDAFVDIAKASIVRNLLAIIPSIKMDYEMQQRNFTGTESMGMLHILVAMHVKKFIYALDTNPSSYDKTKYSQVIGHIIGDLTSVETSLKSMKYVYSQNWVYLPSEVTVANGTTYSACDTTIANMTGLINYVVKILNEVLYDIDNLDDMWILKYKGAVLEMDIVKQKFYSCLDAFPLVLSEVISFQEKALSTIEEVKEQVSIGTVLSDHIVFYSTIESLHNQVKEALYNYSIGNINKMKLAEIFHSSKIDQYEAEVNEVMVNTTRLMKGLEDLISDVENSIVELLNDGITVVSHLDQLYPKSILEKYARNMDILKAPVPDIELISLFRFTLEEDDILTIWPEYLSMADFVESTGQYHMAKLCHDYFEVLLEELNVISSSMTNLVSETKDALESIKEHLKLFDDAIQVEEHFINKNFLRMDVFFAQLKYHKVEQIAAYEISTYFSELGGYMGLLLGASVLTVFELIDFIINNTILKCS